MMPVSVASRNSCLAQEEFMKAVFAINLLVIATLCACSPPDQPPKIAESQREALDKAKAVSDAVNQQMLERNKQIDQQSE